MSNHFRAASGKAYERQSMRRDIFWNTWGSSASAIASAIFVLGTTRISGAHMGGLFSIAFSTAQMLLMLGNYGMRVFQVSDSEPEFSFREYLTSRVITCFLMLLAGQVWCLASQYDFEKTSIVMLVTASRALEAFSDVLEGRMHQCRYLSFAGKSLTIRTVCYSVCYFMALQVTGSLQIACLCMLVSSLICMILFSIRKERALCPPEPDCDIKDVIRLLYVCFPLFLSMFLLMYIVNAPKYAIDRLLSETEQAYYGLLYLPAQVIALFSTFVFKPMINRLTDLWAAKQHTAFNKVIGRVVALIVLLTAGCMLMSWLLGIPILEFLSNQKLTAYRTALVIIMLGGGLSAMASMITQAITIMHGQKVIAIGYLLTLLAAMVLPGPMTRRGGVTAAAFSFVILMAMLSLLLFIGMSWIVRKARK